MSTSKIFQVSDLAKNRTEFIDEARHGFARLRDKDGTSLVMLPESEFHRLQRMEELTGLLVLLEHISHLGRPPSLHELGEHAWLRVFSSDDLEELSTELGRALIAARGDEDTRAADECLKAWRLTARQLEDPLRRSVLTSRLTSDDLVDAPRPEEESSLEETKEPGL